MLWTRSQRPIIFPLFRIAIDKNYSRDQQQLDTAAFRDASSVRHYSKQFVVTHCNDFLPWLERKAGAKISSTLSIGNSSRGRALYASKNIKRGDCLLKVPFSVQLSPDKLPHISFALGDEIGNAAKLAVLILHQQNLGQNSDLAPYINRLPLPQDMHCSIFWSDEELEMIRPSGLYKETLKQKNLIKRDFLAVASVFECTLKEYIYAYQLVKSRAWESGNGVVSLIPFLDFLNHDGNSEARILFDEQKQHSEVIADRDYDAGDDVLIRYGKFSNATLLLSFGFTLSKNTYDFVRIELNVPRDDQLYTQKSSVLYGQRSPNMKEESEFSLSWNSFKLKQIPIDSIRGKGIPLLLRAFVRVLVCDSEQELNELMEAAEMDGGRVGRVPLKNTEKEVAAHQLLHDEISKFVERHNQHMTKLITTPDVGEKSVVRRQLAQHLLRSEVRIMKSACDWLDSYCFMLHANGKPLTTFTLFDV
ncbi:hypothetical protein ACS0TY_012163 [Phlomoides rotata]